MDESLMAVLSLSNTDGRKVLDEKARTSKMGCMSNPPWDKNGSRDHPATNILYFCLIDTEIIRIV